jgi:PilZ domain
MHEKRAHSRSVIRIAVTCTTDGGAAISGVSRDISTGGMYVESSDIPAFGTKIGLKLDAPGLHTLVIPGIVRWTKPDGFGVQFQLLGARETHALAELVRKAQR